MVVITHLVLPLSRSGVLAVRAVASLAALRAPEEWRELVRPEEVLDERELGILAAGRVTYLSSDYPNYRELKALARGGKLRDNQYRKERMLATTRRRERENKGERA